MPSGPKVLVVDDDGEVLSLLDSLLKKKGYDCELAADATEAKQKLTHNSIDLVLCDIMLPDQSGIELCKIIRTNNPCTAVLMVTGIEDPKTIDEALKAGADGYIVKPLEPHTLITQIASAIYHRKHQLLAEVHRKELEKDVQVKAKSLKKTKEKLQEEKKGHREKIKFLYKLFNTVQTGVVLIDEQTQLIKDINEFACNLIGQRREDLIGKNCAGSICPANRGQCPVRDGGEKVCNAEYTLLRADGTQIPVLKSVEPVELDGKPYYVESFVDLSERKQLELDLISKERKLSAITECAKDAIVMLDQDGKISFWNESAVNLFGYSKEDAIGEDLHELIAPRRYFEEFKKAFPKFQSTGKGKAVGRTLELTALKQDGTEFPVELSLSSLQLEGGWHSVGIIRDISDRKLMEERLSKSERFLNDMFNAIQDGISVLDVDLTVRKVNAKVEEWFAQNIPLVGRKCYEVYHNRTKPCTACPTLRAIKSRKTEREIVPGLPGSPVQWIELFSYPIFDNTGKVTGVVEFARDITKIKQTQDSIQKREQLYRSLVESTTDAIVHLDNRRNILSCNKAFLDIFGYEKGEVIGKSIRMLHESEDSFRSFGKTAYPAIAKSGSAKTIWTFVTKHGQKIPFETTTSAIKDESGKITGYVSVMRDITERQQAERALKESEEKYRIVVENIREGIVVGQDGKLKFANPAMSRITGFSKDELLSMPWLNLIHPEDKDLAITNHRKRLEGKDVPETYLMRIIDKQGKTHWLENSGVVIEWEGKPATLNFLTDVTERKLAEDEFRRAHHELEDLIKSISSILIELTPEYVVKRWNRVAEEVFEVDAQEVKGKNLKEIGLTWDLEKVVEGLEDCKNKKNVVRLQDIPFIRSHGKRGFLGITITPKLDRLNELKGFIIMASDITERRNLETQLLQAQKLESVGQLAAGIAHEINTPTQFVGDNIQFLQEAFEDLTRLINAYKQFIDKSKEGSEQKPSVEEVINLQEEIDLDYLMEEIPKAVEQSQEGVKRVARIVKAMKEFSHPGSDEKTPIDLNHSIENTITVARNEWKYVADLETNFDPSLPPVPCLPGELNQVILNMIINAAHAISEVVEKKGGKGKITVSTKQDRQWVEIRISDTGTGIPESIRERIFDPFFTTKEVGKGTGQGLAISRSVIVDKHGGTIDLETEVGKGTTFIIRLPLEEDRPAVKKPE